MYGIKRKKSKNPTEQVRKTKDKKDMARMRRSSEQTLEYKIEQAEAKVAKTKEAHEKAVDELSDEKQQPFLWRDPGIYYLRRDIRG